MKFRITPVALALSMIVGSSLAAISLHAGPAQQEPGVEFYFSLKGAVFHQEIHLAFEKGIHLSDVFAVLGDPEKIDEIDDMIVSIITSGDAVGKNPRNFTLITVAEKYYMTIYVGSRCVETRGAEKWVQSCVIDPSIGSTSSFFVSGKSEIRCEERDRVACVLVSSGEPRNWRILGKTAQRLAVSGAIHNLEDAGLAWLMIANKASVADARSRYADSAVGDLTRSFEARASPFVDDSIPWKKIRSGGAALKASGKASVKTGTAKAWLDGAGQ